MTNKSTVRDLDLRTVVLVGGRDFGRCPLAARLPAALWPIGDRPALVRVLDHLAEEGISEATVCCTGDVATDVESACRDSRLPVRVLVEELINGTGGCLRDAVTSESQGPIFVLSGSMAVPPSVADLIDAHQAGGADLTLAFNPGESDAMQPGPAAEIFLCQPQVLAHIPCGGYSDIKEGVIPAILRAGGTIRPLVLSRPVGNFHDHKGYLDAIDTLFQSGRLDRLGCAKSAASEGGPIYEGVEVFAHPGSRICGPVLIGDHARVLEGAVVVGPAMIGRNVVIGENSAMVRSALWAGAVVGRGCQIRDSILDCFAAVADQGQLVGQAVPSQGSDLAGGDSSRTSSAGGFLGRLAKGMRLSPGQVSLLLGGLVVLAALLWSYWPTVQDLQNVWMGSDEYSSGMLVPLLAVYVIWSRRQEMGSIPVRSAILWGAVAVLFTQAIRAAGLYYMFQSAERLSLVMAVAALVLLMAGWRCLWKLTPVLLFLCLMLPWPNRVQAALAQPLQRWATGSAVFCLELAGWDILRDGNVIRIGDTSVAVAEACNGLRMITAFVVITGLVVLLTRREWWAKLVILISSLPIALLCNTLRLAVTSVAFTIIEGEEWEQGFHDYGGYAMMPLALAMVVGELWVLTRLTTPPMTIEPAVISRRQPQQVSDP